MDALPPEELEKIIVKEIENHIDTEIWNKELKKIKREKEKVRELIQRLAEKLKNEEEKR